MQQDLRAERHLVRGGELIRQMGGYEGVMCQSVWYNCLFHTIL